MKLYSLKTLKDGEFKNIDIDQIKSIPVCSLITLVVMVVEILFLTRFLMLLGINIMSAAFALLACLAITWMCACYITYYFVLCETYIEMKNKDIINLKDDNRCQIF